MNRIPMPLFDRPCSHLRYDGYAVACAELGECLPIAAGPDLSKCPSFHMAGRPRVKAKAEVSDDDDLTEYCPCAKGGK